jgi:hypothetical protein
MPGFMLGFVLNELDEGSSKCTGVYGANGKYFHNQMVYVGFVIEKPGTDARASQTHG